MNEYGEQSCLTATQCIYNKNPFPPLVWREEKQTLVISFYTSHQDAVYHDDVIKWKQFPRYWPFVRGIHRSGRDADDLRRHRAHYDVTVMMP